MRRNRIGWYLLVLLAMVAVLPGNVWAQSGRGGRAGQIDTTRSHIRRDHWKVYINDSSTFTSTTRDTLYTNYLADKSGGRITALDTLVADYVIFLVDSTVTLAADTIQTYTGAATSIIVQAAVTAELTDNAASFTSRRLDTSITDGELLARFRGRGKEGAALDKVGGSIKIQAAGTWGTGDCPSEMLFSVTQDGAATETSYLIMDELGNFSVQSGIETQALGGMGGVRSLMTIPLIVFDSAGGATVEDNVVANRPCYTFNEEGAAQDYYAVYGESIIPHYATTVDSIYVGLRAEHTSGDECKASLYVYKNCASSVATDSVENVTVTAANTWYDDTNGNPLLKIDLTGYSARDYITVKVVAYSEDSNETYIAPYAVIKGEW